MADYNFETEKREAIEAGERALGSLRKAKQKMDNVFADWMVQDRINKARGQIEELIGRVENILYQLRSL